MCSVRQSALRWLPQFVRGLARVVQELEAIVRRWALEILPREFGRFPKHVRWAHCSRARATAFTDGAARAEGSACGGGLDRGRNQWSHRSRGKRNASGPAVPDTRVRQGALRSAVDQARHVTMRLRDIVRGDVELKHVDVLALETDLERRMVRFVANAMYTLQGDEPLRTGKECSERARARTRFCARSDATWAC